MIIVKVQCQCLQWVRVRVNPKPDEPKYEYGWILHTHNGGCGKKIEVERRGGRGARIVGKVDGMTRPIDVEYEE